MNRRFGHTEEENGADLQENMLEWDELEYDSEEGVAGEYEGEFECEAIEDAEYSVKETIEEEYYEEGGAEFETYSGEEYEDGAEAAEYEGEYEGGYAEGYVGEDGEYYEDGAEAAEYEGEYEGEYAEGYVGEDGEYYEDGAEAAEYEGEYEGEYAEGYIGEDGEYYEDAESGEYYEDDAGPVPYSGDRFENYAEEDEEDDSEGGFFAWFSGMSSIMVAAGLVIIVLLLVTGYVLWNRGNNNATSAFASVGLDLDGIRVVGDKGLLNIGNALASKPSEEEPQTQPDKDYGENDYNKNVTVSLKTSSVQKDLKIKFVNKNSDKLISNVPFCVSVTDPNGKVSTWSDDDMDGIIHKKSITPGSYQLTVNELSGDQYASYAIPDTAVSAQVRKDIAYQKVDVSGEVKKESEVNVANEEQKRPQDVESGLTDTVEWVESTQVVNTYVEVAKSKIPDPSTLAKAGTFLRLAGKASIDKSSAKLVVGGEPLALKGSYTEPEKVSAETWESSDTSVAEVDYDGVVTPISAGTAVITFTVTATDGENETTSVASCKITVTNPEGDADISVDTTYVELKEGASQSVQATASGFEEGRAIAYTAESDAENICTVTAAKTGKITIKAVGTGDATVTISANYTDDPLDNVPSVTVSVTVTPKGLISLGESNLVVVVGKEGSITINAADSATVTAKSSDDEVATVKIKDSKAVVTGVKAGTATITVTAKLGDEKESATCAVTVKADGSGDKTSKLKDKDGNQLYVQEGDAYREAVYADYYKDGVKFFKKGEVKYTGWQTIDGNVYFFDKTGKKVTGEQVIQGARYVFNSEGVLQKGSGVMGIDVSKHNGTIDWAAVKKAGVSYVIIRCGYRGYTQGSLIIDSKFEENIKGATAAGIKVGVYFFSQAVDEVEAVEEASFVLDAVKNYKISYPIYLDVEYSGAAGNKGRADKLSKSARTAVCKAFCETIRSGGYTAGVYANRTWLEEMIDPGQLGSYKIWLAQYAATPTYSGRYEMWQYTCTGKVNGISGKVDLNLSYMAY